MESSNKDTLISQGAEARVSLVRYLGRNAVLKRRLRKRYRHEELDTTLTNKRMMAECRAVARLRRHGVYVPLIYLADLKNRYIIHEFIEGETVLEVLSNASDDLRNDVLQRVGEILAMMHDVNVVHGDLTTRNMLRTESGEICLIDFGLSYVSTLAEDKGVDLYVLERCCSAEQFELLLDAYKKHSKSAAQTIAKLAEVRLRGRKRDLAG
ncbi:TP53-regulating kinase [Babesia sp. Xinjiang]|uniref:TP53-regulating kinase n=1 Tax=Babesia sp. Xinjiang TaxID=462227 RepID=UPI000A222BEF|nr:TP53-regulating kinase [Babesia sp. Xinjiang]ORM40097.1 TP53-regulating kinase [Babesia sp. Xinjiang]